MKNNQELRNFINSNSLEESVKIISPPERTRPIYGANSVMLRTLGEQFQISSYQKKYFDDFRKKKVMTEFAEFCDALQKYDDSKNQGNLMKLILEAGDVIYQSIILDTRYAKNEHYTVARSQMDAALSYINNELNKRGVSVDNVKKVAKIKYGIRSWMIIKGLPIKNKHLEEQLCLEELNNL